MPKGKIQPRFCKDCQRVTLHKKYTVHSELTIRCEKCKNKIYPRFMKSPIISAMIKRRDALKWLEKYKAKFA